MPPPILLSGSGSGNGYVLALFNNTTAVRDRIAVVNGLVAGTSETLGTNANPITYQLLRTTSAGRGRNSAPGQPRNMTLAQYGAMAGLAPLRITIDSGNGSIEPPSGYSYVRVECWGAGGNGDNAGLGGNGGAYARSVLPINPGVLFDYNVAPGGDTGGTWFGSSSTVYAECGVDGGQAADSIGDTTYSGGVGQPANGGTGGGGGGESGGPERAGADGLEGFIDDAGAGGGSGSSAYDDYGGGGSGGPSATDGEDGYAPGGGGGGSVGGFFSSGANGQLRITFFNDWIEALFPTTTYVDNTYFTTDPTLYSVVPALKIIAGPGDIVTWEAGHRNGITVLPSSGLAVYSSSPASATIFWTE